MNRVNTRPDANEKRSSNTNALQKHSAMTKRIDKGRIATTQRAGFRRLRGLKANIASNQYNGEATYFVLNSIRG